MKTQWHMSEKDFFSGLPQEKEAFIFLSQKQVGKKNDIIFHEEDNSSFCYYLENGFIKIFCNTALGKEPTFFIRKTGEMLGLADLLNGQVRKCSARAITSFTLYAMNKKTFDEFLVENSVVARRVMEVLGARLRYLGEQVHNLMVCDVTTRMIKLLLYMGHDELLNSYSQDEPITFKMDLTQEQIASLTGTCQQTVSETMKKLQESRLIDISNKNITIINPLEMLESVS
ncbi:Crp/Fnr family transcriptional regulator [bacterium]|nr:Crp/Fnr family transcriptional regulator [bacterium]